MGSALIGGLAGKLTAGQNIHVVDTNKSKLQELQKTFGVTVSAKLDDSISSCDVIVLAVKPQNLKEVATQLSKLLSKQLVLSIAAGIRIQDLSLWLGGYSSIVRAMPNTPALIGLGITGLTAIGKVSSEQKNIAEKIMRAVGETVWLSDENQIDAVTAVSGSGPAYVFYFMEAIQKAAIDMGLNKEQAKVLVTETFAGASQLVLRSEENIATLREQVTSKGGTTFAALTSMEQNGVSDLIVCAVGEAEKRSKELGIELSNL